MPYALCIKPYALSVQMNTSFNPSLFGVYVLGKLSSQLQVFLALLDLDYQL
jgi:hypothetical protein